MLNRKLIFTFLFLLLPFAITACGSGTEQGAPSFNGLWGTGAGDVEQSQGGQIADAPISDDDPGGCCIPNYDPSGQFPTCRFVPYGDPNHPWCTPEYNRTH